MAEEQPKEKLVKVKVRVPDRSAQGFGAYYAAQRRWPNGDSEAVIPESKAKELQAETSLLVVVSIEPTSEPVERGPDPIATAAAPMPASTATDASPPATDDKGSPGRPLRRP